MAKKTKNEAGETRNFYRIETMRADGETVGGYMSAMMYLFSLILSVKPEEITDELLYSSQGKNEDFDTLLMTMAALCDIPKPQEYLDNKKNYCLYQGRTFLEDEIYDLDDLDEILRNLTNDEFFLIVKSFKLRDAEIIYEDDYQIVVSEEVYKKHNKDMKWDELSVLAESLEDAYEDEMTSYFERSISKMEEWKERGYIGSDRQGMYNLLVTFDDREIARFEKSIKETVYDDYQAEIEIGKILVNVGIADETPLGGFRVRMECAKVYEHDIKGTGFDEDRKRTSWVKRCFNWCDNMCGIFSKKFLQKLINQNSDIRMDEKEMMKRLGVFRASNVVEYREHLISFYYDKRDKGNADLYIEEKIEDSAYIPTVQEIDEFYYRGFLFSKPSYQKLYKFLTKEMDDEAEAYRKVSDAWGEFQIFSEPESLIVSLDDDIFFDTKKRNKTIELLKKAERETNIGHYYGNTIDTAIENDLDLKVKYLVPLNEESEKVRKKNKGGKEKMTYEKIVEKVKKALAKADVSEVKEHLAVQVDVYGEGEGAFYIEAKDGKVNVQPYEYFDHDLRIRCTGDEIVALAEGKKKIIDEVNAGNIEALRNVSRLWDLDTVLSANKAKAKAEKKAKVVKKEKPVKKEKAIAPAEKKVAKAETKVKADKKVKTEKKSKTTKVEKPKKSQKTEKTE